MNTTTSDNFSWAVINDYIHPFVDTTYNNLVPQLTGKNLLNPIEEVRIYINPSLLDNLEDNTCPFVLEITNGIEDTEFLTGFSSFADILSSLREWHSEESTEHVLLTVYESPSKEVKEEFYARNSELLKSLEK